MAETVAWCRVNGGGTLPDAFELDPGDLELATTLPPQALRNLFAHSEVHLNVEWRDMIDADWEITVSTQYGEKVALRSFPLFRAVSLWKASLDLGARGRWAPQGIDDSSKDCRLLAALGRTQSGVHARLPGHFASGRKRPSRRTH